MKLVRSSGLIALVVMVLLAGCATGKAGGGSDGKKFLSVIDAWSTSNYHGVNDGQNNKAYYFVLVWLGDAYPETFFWRGDGGWANCRVEKVHRTTIEQQRQSGTGAYMRDRTPVADFRKGDTLMLTPVRGGKFPIPDEISEDVKNTIFFKTAGSGWLYESVKDIADRKGEAAPYAPMKE